ncbi:BrnT family toxin [Variovorax sp. GT1P44]|uniref:BrnT family toxin n=1 Tax=Variovorax sp. GT1P44 TaxID=3443742 RepID=UPI003F44B681
MLITFDTAKRDKTLAERRLDFARSGEVFAGPVLTLADDRADYGEARFISFGLLDGRHVVVVWTPRGEARRVISMRNANEREIARHTSRFR